MTDIEVSNPNNTPQIAAARVLNQLLAAASVLNAFASITKMSEFVAQALKTVPGVTACAVCMFGDEKPSGDDMAIAQKICGAMKKPGGVEMAATQLKACDDIDRNRPFIPIAASRKPLGYAFFELCDRQLFDAYKAPVNNFITFFAMRAENIIQTTQLTEYKNHLEKLVAARTAEVEKARAEAEMASNAKSVFLASVSHELRTPMNAIIGFNELMNMSGLEPEQREYYQMIKAAADHLLEIINAMLDLACLEADKFKLDLQPFDLVRAIENAVALVRKPANIRNIKLTLELDSALPKMVIGDQHRFRQIVLNLLTNAVKFTPAGAVSVVARRIRLQDNISTISLSIEDTGIGIPANQLKEIFEMFHQLAETNTKRYEGSGLGLAVVKSLLKAMNGTIRVESEIDRGSRFTIEVPFKIADDKKNTNDESAAGSGAGVVSDHSERPPRALNILLAEDNESNSLIVEKYFKILNWNVVVARDGGEAVNLFVPSAFDAIIMDIQMPVMNGYEAARKIREMEAGTGKRVPIIAFTAYALENDREKCLAAGMDDYVTKPINVNALKETILKNIRR